MLMFFDTEVYSNYFLALFKSETGQVYRFENKDASRLKDFIKANKENTFVSFNGNGFDVPILNAFIAGKTTAEIKAICDAIISSGDSVYKVAKQFKISTQASFDHIDIMEIPIGQVGLKTYGGRIHAPKIQDLPLEPDAKITTGDLALLREYCLNDVETTELLYRTIEPQIKLREALSKQYGVDLRSKSDAQIAEAVILSELSFDALKPKIKTKTYRYQIPAFIRFQTPLFQSLLDEISTTDFTVTSNGKTEMPANLAGKQIRLNRSVYSLGIGGLHSCESSRGWQSNEDYLLIDADVTSYYPMIILGQRLSPEHLGDDFLNVYKSIVYRRIAAKKAGDSVTEKTLKIVINGSFGKFGSPYSCLYSPELLTQVTITGQLALLMLIEALETHGIAVVSANTDGIVSYVPKDKLGIYDSLLMIWEIETGFSLEKTEYNALYSESVNNYIAITTSGKTKGKGVYADESLSKNPTAIVCIDAVKAYLSKGSSIEQHIMSCTDIRKFVCSRSVTGGAIKDGEYLGKTVRWYYSTSTQTAIYYKKNGNKVPKSDCAMPIQQLPQDLPNDINYSWYIASAKKMLVNLGYNQEKQPKQKALL